MQKFITFRKWAILEIAGLGAKRFKFSLLSESNPKRSDHDRDVVLAPVPPGHEKKREGTSGKIKKKNIPLKMCNDNNN